MIYGFRIAINVFKAFLNYSTGLNECRLVLLLVRKKC